MSQRVYFALSSDVVTAAEVTGRLGLEPDELAVRGSNRLAPSVVPVQHSWSVHCRDSGVQLDVQVERILARLAPVADKLRDLVSTEDVSATLCIARFFNTEDGEEESDEATITEDGRALEKIRGQHQLLGWYLSSQQLEFLVSLGAAISADEYG